MRACPHGAPVVGMRPSAFDSEQGDLSRSHVNAALGSGALILVLAALTERCGDTFAPIGVVS